MGKLFRYIYEGNIVYYCGEHCYAEILSIELPNNVWIKYSSDNQPIIERVSMGLIFEDEDDWDNYASKLYT